ncbi:hypothetical protein RJ641_004918 [Dillenia turbinata]|uniref:Uncharacterized protein n=1 Tax=Dillenia turbinata TaxID=194707 RepID=A0AAN8ZCK7_9MAGN
MSNYRMQRDAVGCIFLRHGSLEGKFVDATPFAGSCRKKNGETDPESSSLVEKIGSMLVSLGFDYGGMEVLYSGLWNRVCMSDPPEQAPHMFRFSYCCCVLSLGKLSHYISYGATKGSSRDGLPPARASKKVTCLSCRTSKGMETVAMPFVFRYLAVELAATNIKLMLQLANATDA